MDPGRQHAFLNNSEDCTRPVYYNKANDDLIAPPDIYSKPVTVSKETCKCAIVSGNSICSACCRNAVDNDWKHHHLDLNTDFRNVDNNNKILGNDPMHIHALHNRLNTSKGKEDSLNKSYWTQSKHDIYMNNSISSVANFVHPHLKKPTISNSIGSKNFEIETNFRQCGQPTANLQHNFSVLDSCCDERWAYEEKYSLKNESYTNEKIAYTPLAHKKGLVGVNDISHNEPIKMEVPCASELNQRIVLSNNIMPRIKGDLSSSPNYMHKCMPSVNNCAASNSCHTNLYVPPPQFSSEKFNSINLQTTNLPDQIAPQDYTGFNNGNINPNTLSRSSVHLHTNVKPAASPLPLGSNKNCYLPSPSQDASQELASSPINLANQTGYYYHPSVAKVETTRRSPIILERVQVPQYSKLISPQHQTPPPQQHSLPQNVSSYAEKCVKRKDDYEINESRNRHLYINPYNTNSNITNDTTHISPSPKSVNHCTEEKLTTAYGTNTRPCNSPLRCYTNKISRVSSKTRNNSKQQIYAHAYVGSNSSNTYYCGNTNSDMKLSSSVLSATPTPPHLAVSPQIHHSIESNTPQLHHSTCTSQTHLAPANAEESPKQPQMLFGRHRNKMRQTPTSTPPSAPIKIQTINHSTHTYPQGSNSQPRDPLPTASQSTKKTQVIKPNYRELINHAYAMRNCTSEEELNLQIIKKALNVDVPTRIPRPHISPVEPSPTIIQANIVMTDQMSPESNMQYPQNSSILTQLPLNYSHKNGKTDMQTNIGEEKDTNFSPLDLSMRTIKTKADSTECNHREGSLVTPTDFPNTKYSLPRVDFTPNFSLHTSGEGETNGVYGEAKRYEHKEDNRQTQYAPLSNQKSSLLQNEKGVSRKSSRIIHTGLTTTTTTTTTSLPPTPDLREKQKFSSSASPSIIVPPPSSFETRKKFKQNLCENVQIFQSRPSVLEANPYAQPKSQKLPGSDTSAFLNKNLPVISKMSPDTSISPHSETNYINLNSPQNIATKISAPKPQPTHTFSERNPNFLGRKRHLHEYNKSQKNESQNNKLMRYDSSPPLLNQVPPHLPPPTTTTSPKTNVLVENKFCGSEVLETRENVIAAKINELPLEKANVVNTIQNGRDYLVCKQETVPTNPPPMIMSITIKSEPTTPVTTASRIRTKAELKGFTFNISDIDNVSLKDFKIKEEPPTTPIPRNSSEDFNQNIHADLDFNWSNTCNNFMEQLLTTSVRKRSPKKSLTNSLSDNNDNIPVTPVIEANASIPHSMYNLNNAGTLIKQNSVANQIKQNSVLVSQIKPNTVVEQIKKNVVMDQINHNTVVDRTKQNSAAANQMNLNAVVDQVKQNAMVDLELKKITYNKTVTNDSTMSPFKPTSQDSSWSVPATVIQKKFTKLEREKIRQQQEKRIAARRLQESSSESENEVNKRLTERQKKPTKRSKVRGIATEKKHYSDCGSDSTTNQDTQDSDRDERIKKPTNFKNQQIQQNSKINEINKRKRQNLNVEANVIIKNRKKYENVNLNIRNKTKIINKKQREISLTKLPEQVRNGPMHECHKQGAKEEEEKKDHNRNKVQYKSASIKDKQLCNKKQKMKNNKTQQKKIISLNTMTRSKCKRELEMQLANSKVLRNEKIIRNSTTKIKRKYVRKFVSNIKQTITNGDKDEPTPKRLSNEKRTKTKQAISTEGNDVKAVKKRPYKKKQRDGAHLINAISNQETTAPDLLLEVYRYKRALKVPASLITIRHPSNNHRLPSSLSDFEQRATQSKIHEEKVLLNEKGSPKSTSLKSTSPQEPLVEPKSIIDLLHSRVIMSNIRPLCPKTKTSKINTSNSSLHSQSETSQTTEANSISLGELLPTPKKELPENSDGKRRHFSIFDTKVLKTKTRTESKLQQKKEILREIFVGEERPASAPPEMIQQVENVEKMTYEQKYEQFLQQMNIVINEKKLHKFNQANVPQLSSATIKEDKIYDVKTKQAAEGKFKCQPDPVGDRGVGTVGEAAINCFRRRRPTKYLRRKGSSGFDYIRKKKKPSSASNNNLMSLSTRADRSEEIYGKVKTENDVCREIQKWVLNKGVGQSAMHKAARLGYIDVIVYCIDRMGLNPNQKDNAGYTPLHEACTYGQLEISRVLLQYGANHSEAAHSGIRPLHEASENDNLEIVRMLLSYGADPLLATYSGQTPLMLASSSSMRELLTEHLLDVQEIEVKRSPWRFNGPWEILDEAESGYDIFQGAPSVSFDGRFLNNLTSKKKHNSKFLANGSKSLANNCVILNKADHNNFDDSLNGINTMQPRTTLTFAQSEEYLTDNSDSEGELFEFEEADMLLPPLYLLKDEGMDKWVLLSDLCNLLKVKSKDTLLNKIYPSSSISTTHKSHMKELKMSDFLEKATCLQLLCAGEKINICASKVVLIKYNDNVRNLLGVKTILMKF